MNGNGQSVFVVKGRGDVGIGTTTPSTKLEVLGNIKADKFIGDGSELTNLPSMNSLWYQSGDDIYYNQGKVGIGTTNPLSNLSVGGDGFSSTGVYAKGSSTGVYAEGSSTGVYGEGYVGVIGYSDDPNSFGVYGEGEQIGVEGMSDNKGVRGNGDIGVYGWGYTYALYGYSLGEYGVYARGTNYGGYFDGDVYVSDDLNVAGYKSFVQPHASDPSKEIVYIAAEAPEAIIMFRGIAQLKEGKAIIELPEHFRVVAAKQGVQIQVTPLEDCNGIFVASQDRDQIEVRELMNGKHNIRFNYLITAVRSGFEAHQPVMANTHFKPRVDETVQEFEARYNKDNISTRAIRNMLIANGILTQDAKLNLSKVKDLGWTIAEEKSSSDSEFKPERIQR